MLKPYEPEPPTELDQIIFQALVGQDHYLRQVKSLVNFERCHDLLADCYHPCLGRSAKEPVLLLKLLFLQFHYGHSDREVIAAAGVNIAYRFFLDLSLKSPLPDHSLLSRFRTRLGPDNFQKVFDDVLAQAREHGLLKDRLRLKDATHVLANIAIPSTLLLVAQTRDRLLDACRPFDEHRVACEQAKAQTIHTATADLSDQERLLQRVAHLRELVAWADTLADKLDLQEVEQEPPRRQLRQALNLAHRVLADRPDPPAAADPSVPPNQPAATATPTATAPPAAPDPPAAPEPPTATNPPASTEKPADADKPDRVISVYDTDARWGKHGDYFAGYLLDLSMDADSELITRVHVLPGNADEAADAKALIQEEEQRHGNDVEGLSIDGAGFRGELLREWQDPEQLGLEVTVPPSPEPEPTGRFTPEQFPLDEQSQELSCPGGQKTRQRERTSKDTGWKYRFRRQECAACPLLGACMGKTPGKTGRTVIKNDYEQEYARARQRASTPEYKEVRKQHPKVERKLGELARWHRLRRARYWGRGKVLVQGLLTAVVVNVKRLVKLLGPAEVRAEAAAGLA